MLPVPETDYWVHPRGSPLLRIERQGQFNLTVLYKSAPADAEPDTKVMVTVGSPFGIAFVDQYPTPACKVNSCKMYKAGCTVLYDGEMLTIDETYPFNVKATQNSATKYTEDICLKCTSDL